MRLVRTTIATPLGEMLALASDEGLCALEFAEPEQRLPRLEARLRRWFPPHEIVDEETRMLRRTRAWLSAYFDGATAVRSPIWPPLTRLMTTPASAQRAQKRSSPLSGLSPAPGQPWNTMPRKPRLMA